MLNLLSNQAIVLNVASRKMRKLALELGYTLGIVDWLIRFAFVQPSHSSFVLKKVHECHDGGRHPFNQMLRMGLEYLPTFKP